MSVSVQPPKTVFLFFVLMLFTGWTPTALEAQDARADEAKLPRNSSIYAKIILPTKAPVEDKDHLVESWITQRLAKRGEAGLRAVTEWVHLPEKGEDYVFVWNAVLDGKLWGCPVAGRVVQRTANGRVKVTLNGWGPSWTKVKGTSLRAEAGSRKIAVVGAVKGQPIAYVALIVGPRQAENDRSAIESVGSPSQRN